MLVLGNSLILSLDAYDNKPSTIEFLVWANKSFTVIFSIEMILKLCGLGVKDYLRDEYNLFDGMLVIISVVDITLEEVMGAATGASVITAFRMLRLLRIFKLASRSEGLIVLLEAIKNTLSDLMYFALLLVLFIFICALVGMD